VLAAGHAMTPLGRRHSCGMSPAVHIPGLGGYYTIYYCVAKAHYFYAAQGKNFDSVSSFLLPAGI
jgi:hypothetical protein